MVLGGKFRKNSSPLDQMLAKLGNDMAESNLMQ